MKYILVGTPNVGKSTLGKRVAAELGLPFYDIDGLVTERITPQSHLEMLQPSFAQRVLVEQAKVLAELSQKDESTIIATGASLPSDAGCADILPNIGVIIHIKRNIDSARADAIKRGGLTLVRLDKDGKAIEGSEINFSAKAVEEYASDLPLHESISDFTLENDGDIDSGVIKLIELIRSIRETPKREELMCK